MREYEVDVNCPLCNAQTRLNRLRAHAKKSHPDVSAADFKKALEQKINSDPSTVDLRRVTRSVNMVSATVRVGRTCSGGAVGIRKLTQTNSTTARN